MHFYPEEPTGDPFSGFIEHRLETLLNVQKLQRSLGIHILSHCHRTIHKPFVTFIQAFLLEVDSLGHMAETRECDIVLLLIKVIHLC